MEDKRKVIIKISLRKNKLVEIINIVIIYNLMLLILLNLHHRKLYNICLEIVVCNHRDFINNKNN